jgi:hypothetical protein
MKKIMFATKKDSKEFQTEVDIFCFKTYVKVGKIQQGMHYCLCYDIDNAPLFFAVFCFN